MLEFTAPFAPCANSFPCVGGAAANVFGLTGSSTQSCVTPPSSTTLCSPKGVALDSKDELFVADSGAHCVLGYFTPLSSTTANIVFGQGTSTSFTTGDCNHPSSTVSASSLCGPKAVAADAIGNIYIADTTNNRVLEFNELNPPANVTANVVFGQAGSMTTNGCNQGGVSANSLCSPTEMAFDSAGNLYIADGNSRTLEFNTPLMASATPGSGDTTADRVFGQADNMTSHACNLAGSPAASTECGPTGFALDTAGDLFVVDAGNNRILKYARRPPLPPHTSTRDRNSNRHAHCHAVAVANQPHPSINGIIRNRYDGGKDQQGQEDHAQEREQQELAPVGDNPDGNGGASFRGQVAVSEDARAGKELQVLSHIHAARHYAAGRYADDLRQRGRIAADHHVNRNRQAS